MNIKSKRCRECCSSAGTGPNHNAWKGGRTYTEQGYVRVYAPDHPKANGKYVLEHKLVMEESLGRFLLPTETVHHINGIRDDNRIENLELWVKPQPNGVRAMDALEWARKIIATYGPVESII